MSQPAAATRLPGPVLLAGRPENGGRGPGWSQPARPGLPGPVLLLAAAVLVVYANSLLNGYALDDVYIVAQNPRVHELGDLRAIWLRPYWPYLGTEAGLYRPLAIFAFAVQWALGGGAAWVFHAGNVLLHAGVTVLVFLLLRRLVGGTPALVGGLLFAVHPVHTEAVANVVGQAELLAAAAVLGACLVHAGRPAGLAVSWGRRLVLVVLFGVGILSKESAVVLPGLLVLVDLVQGRVALTRRGLVSYGAALLVPLVLIGAALACYLLVRLEVLGGALMGVDAGPQLPYLKEHRLLNAYRAVPELVRLLFFPVELASDYAPAVILPVESWTPMAGLGLGLLAGIALLAVLVPWVPAAGFPAAWFLVSVSPVSNLFFPIGVLLAERTLYLPSVAVCALAGYAWQHLEGRVAAGRQRRLLVVAAGVVLVALGVRSMVRNPDWKSSSTLLGSAVRDHPESYRAQWSLAKSYALKGDLARAAFHYDVAYRIYQRDSALLTDRADLRFSLGERHFPEAVAMLETAHAMHPYVLKPASLLAYGYLATGRFAEALGMIRRVEELGGERAVTMPMRAYASEGLGDWSGAAAAWRAAVRQPGGRSWQHWSFLARALAAAGDEPGAREAVRLAGQYAPSGVAGGAVARLGAAVAAGCYRQEPVPAASSAAAGTAPGAVGPRLGLPRPACDPLGDWLLSLARPSGEASLSTREADEHER